MSLKNSSIVINESALSPQRLGRLLINFTLKSSSAISIGMTLAICIVLIFESGNFFEHVSPLEFLFGDSWSPLIEPRKFGVFPIVWGSLLIAGLSICFALPIGILLAVYLSDYASPGIKKFLKPTIEIFAGIPSIVYGYLAISAITPMLRHFFPETEFFNALSAAIVVTTMILPTIVSISDDAISAVPRELRKAGLALGAAKHEVIFKIVLPAATSGIIAAVILAFSRAIGETMAVTLAAGATPRVTVNLLESVQTMTAFIVQASMGDTPHGTIEYYSIFAVAALLFLITLCLNIGARIMTRNVRKKFA